MAEDSRIIRGSRNCRNGICSLLLDHIPFPLAFNKRSLLCWEFQNFDDGGGYQDED